MYSIIFIIKIILLSTWLIIIRGTLPRYRIDQMLTNTWKDWTFVWVFFLGVIVLYALFFYY